MFRVLYRSVYQLVVTFVREMSGLPGISLTSVYRGQTVTLTTTTPHTTVRIVGISPDYGLLRTEPLGGGQYIDLQPDSNSFDMMKGLIKTKTN